MNDFIKITNKSDNKRRRGIVQKKDEAVSKGQPFYIVDNQRHIVNNILYIFEV